MKIENLELSEEQKKLVEDGRWVDNIPEMEGVRLKVRGSNNRDWRRMAQRLINAEPRKNRINGLDPDAADRISAIILLNTGLLDWEGIEDANDQPIPYSKKKAAEYLAGERFRAGAQFACDQVAQGIEDEVEEVAGN